MSIIQGIHICSLYKDCIQRSIPFDISLVTDHNIQSFDSSLLTLLHYAVMFRDISLVQFISERMLEKNISVDVHGIMSRTPLFFSSDPDVSILLITNGADVNHTDNEGNTPLHCVFERFINQLQDEEGEERENCDFSLFYKNVKVFLWNGASPLSLNQQQVSPKDLYKTLFPNELNDGEDDEIREMMNADSNELSDISDITDMTSDRQSDLFSSVESLDRQEGN